MRIHFSVLAFGASLFLLAPAMGALRQATRGEIVQREKFADVLMPRSTIPGCNMDRRRSTDSYKARRSSIPRGLWSGDLLGPEDVAAFLIGGGSFLHTNGSIVTDADWMERTIDFQTAKYGKRAATPGWIDRFQNKAIDLTMKVMASGIVSRFQDPDELYQLSDVFAFENRNVVRLLRAMLEDEDFDEFMVLHRRIKRPVIESLVDVLCPRMGPVFCSD